MGAILVAIDMTLYRSLEAVSHRCIMAALARYGSGADRPGRLRGEYPDSPGCVFNCDAAAPRDAQFDPESTKLSGLAAGHQQVLPISACGRRGAVGAVRTAY